VDNPELEWAAPRGAVALGLIGAVGLLAAVFVSALDGPGRLLLGVAGVAVGAAAVFGLRARPRLAATGETLAVRGLLGARVWPWTRVDAVRVVRMRRLGLPTAYLEIDARDDDGTERLLVLGRLELGADPVDVAAALQAHRARAGRGGGPRSAADAAGGPLADDAAEGQVAQRDRGDEGDDDPRGDPEADDRT
jgi:hypothetical protein